MAGFCAYHVDALDPLVAAVVATGPQPIFSIVADDRHVAWRTYNGTEGPFFTARFSGALHQAPLQAGHWLEGLAVVNSTLYFAEADEDYFLSLVSWRPGGRVHPLPAARPFEPNIHSLQRELWQFDGEWLVWEDYGDCETMDEGSARTANHAMRWGYRNALNASGNPGSGLDWCIAGDVFYDPIVRAGSAYHGKQEDGKLVVRRSDLANHTMSTFLAIGRPSNWFRPTLSGVLSFHETAPPAPWEGPGVRYAGPEGELWHDTLDGTSLLLWKGRLLDFETAEDWVVLVAGKDASEQSIQILSLDGTSIITLLDSQAGPDGELLPFGATASGAYFGTWDKGSRTAELRFVQYP